MLDQLQSQVNSTETASGMRFRGFLTYLILYLCLVALFKHMFLQYIFHTIKIRLDTERSWCSQRTSQIRENFSEVEDFHEKESPAVSVSSRTGSLVYVNEKHLVVPKVTSHSSLGDRERNTEPEKPLLRTRSTPKLSKSGPTIRARNGIYYFRNDR